LHRTHPSNQPTNHLQGSIFDDFFQDPEVQTLLHVRGYDLPGLNFLPEGAAAPEGDAKVSIESFAPILLLPMKGYQ
jgi:hypothetical protein